MISRMTLPEIARMNGIICRLDLEGYKPEEISYAVNKPISYIEKVIENRRASETPIRTQVRV